MFYDPYKQATSKQQIKKDIVAFSTIRNKRTYNNNYYSSSKNSASACVNCSWQSKLESFLQSYWWLIAIAIIVILIIYFEVI